jgi:hypothetical protein
MTAAFFGAIVATGAIAAAAWSQDLVIGTPPIAYLGFVGGGAVLALGWALLTTVRTSRAAS